jgi:hypothetical protein
LEDYPLPGERVTIHLGQPVEELYRTYQIARAGGLMPLRRLYEKITETEEAAALQKAQTEPLRDNLTRWNWYITIMIEREIELPDTQCTPARWFSIDPGLAAQLEREFLTYGSYQADFLVDHLAASIPKHFFTTRDADDRIVFFAENGPPFRMFQETAGEVTVKTSGPMELCNVEQIRVALSKLQSEGQMALTPLTPATLVALVERATTSDLKGRALEELVSKLFLTIPGLTVIKRVKTTTEEIDIFIFKENAPGFLASEEAVILAECKNWSGKCGRGEFSQLEMKAQNRKERCSLNFLISWNGFADTIEKELLRLSRQRLMIVPLTGDDLRKAVEDNNFFGVINVAWQKVIFT